MNTPEEFQRMMSAEFPTEYTDATPYGGPTHPHKPGLTKRGKAAIAIGATVIAGGSLIGYQAYSAQSAAHEAKTQEIALQQQRLELEELKEKNRLNESNKKTQNSAEKSRQASVDSCVKSQKDQIGKVLGVTYRQIVDDCQAQYLATTDTSDMQSTANAQDATTTATAGGDINLNGGLVIGGVVLIGFLTVALKGKRNNAA